MASPQWTIVTDEKAFKAALKLTKGIYQYGFICGYQNLSCSTLRGKASMYSGRYKQSQQNVLDRMTAAGIPWCEQRGSHNKRLLVIGASNPN
jgi:hypothetical protein